MVSLDCYLNRLWSSLRGCFEKCTQECRIQISWFPWSPPSVFYVFRVKLASIMVESFPLLPLLVTATPSTLVNVYVWVLSFTSWCAAGRWWKFNWGCYDSWCHSQYHYTIAVGGPWTCMQSGECCWWSRWVILMSTTHLRELMKLMGKSWQLITAIHDEEGEAWVWDFVNRFHKVMTCTRCCVTFRVFGGVCIFNIVIIKNGIWQSHFILLKAFIKLLRKQPCDKFNEICFLLQ
jgi:hypothetical protein